MILPKTKETQNQIQLWMEKAREAKQEDERLKMHHYYWAIGNKVLPDPYTEKYKWGVRFLNEMLLKVMSPDLWLLASFKDRPNDEYCSEFGFVFVVSDRYLWDEYGMLRTKNFPKIRRTNWIIGAHTIWTKRYKFECHPDKDGLGNLIFNGAMINRGTVEQPSWSSHS